MLAALAISLLLTVACLPLGSHQGGAVGDGSLDAVLQHIQAGHAQNRARFDNNIRDLTIRIGGRVYTTPITQDVDGVNNYSDDRMRQHWNDIREYVVGSIQEHVPSLMAKAVRQLRAQLPNEVQQSKLVQHNLRQIQREAANYVKSVEAQLNLHEDQTLTQLDLAYADAIRLGGIAIAVARNEPKYQEKYMELFEASRNLVRQKESMFWQVKELNLRHFVKRVQALANQIRATQV